VVVVVGNVFVDELHRFWNLLTICIELHIVKQQIEHVPCPLIHRLISHSVLCLDFGNP
jgi:hypothetical protein